MLSLDALQARLSSLDSADALRELFADWSYEADSAPVYLAQATRGDERAQEALAADPEIITRAGEFEVIYAPLHDWDRAIGAERLVISRLLSDHPFALWIFSDASATKWHLVNVKRGAGTGATAMGRHVLRRFSFHKGEAPGRTSVERLRNLDLATAGVLPGMAPPPLEIQARHDEAFDVEAVTHLFFRDYKLVFEAVEAQVLAQIKDEGMRRLWTQRLFNRLMFMRFLEKKGWLEYEGDTKYLSALFKAAEKSKQNFLEDRLYFAFFEGLNTYNESKDRHSTEELVKRRGKVPFLNGGLFELDEEWDARGKVSLPNEAFRDVLDLFEKYNFTITESTPFDQEVGVDPEMLGKVFEELTNERTESGSYYTPRVVVSFMAREALKGYLSACDSALAIEKFVDASDASGLKRPRQVLAALEEVRICDPACGSGAYLLGMMQELLRLRESLFASHAIDALELYDRKLDIIERNLYGADITEFAVNIAMLRLWLSLAVDYNGPVKDLPALPNLSYKIGRGDSLTAPNPTELSLNSAQYKALARDLSVLHKEWFEEGRKRSLGQVVRTKAEILSDINEKTGDIKKMFGDDVSDGAHDWRVQFAEAFAHEGFDIVLANPPYGATVADATRGSYFPGESQSKDTYGLFMARGLQLLKPGGWFTYIVSDTWRTIKTHRPLRKRLLAQSQVAHVIDLPAWIFGATVNTGVLTFQKGAPKDGHSLIAVDIRNLPQNDWDALAAQLIAIARHGDDIQNLSAARYTYPQSAVSTYDNASFFIADPSLYALMSDKRFQPLGSVADVPQGISTGQNKYYVRRQEEGEGYEAVDSSKVLRAKEIVELSLDEKLKGVDPEKYGGRHFVPFDKGGGSDSGEGWMPNYFAPTQFFIDWSRSALQRMRTLTIAARKKQEGKADKISKGDENKIAAALRNSDAWFKPAITFSPTGIYSPTFRVGVGGVFQNTGSGIICEKIPVNQLLGLLCSTWARYLLKNSLNHTVHTQEGDLANFPLPRLN